MSVSIGGGGAMGAAVQQSLSTLPGAGAPPAPPPGYSAAVDAFRAAQRELQLAVEAESSVRAQKNESDLVRSELAALKPGETVYKLMGPMLVRQEQADARSVVDGRLEFLEKELQRLEDNIKRAQEKQLAARRTLLEMQQSMAGGPRR